jgi:DNA-binding LytR/AlgR family response regulator
MANTTLRCCVIDDEPLACELIASYVRRTPRLELVGSYTSVKDAIELITSGTINLLFLDIQMPQMSGIELARIVPETTRIVFVTAYSNYAVEGFRVNALDYLLKPVSYDEFLETIKRALNYVDSIATPEAPKRASANEPEYLMIKSEHKLIRIRTHDIDYIESLKDYVKIYLVGETRSIMSLMSLKSIEQTLPSFFMRIHRSFIVNMERVNLIEKSRVIFGNKYVPISDSYREQFFATIEHRSSFPKE